MRATLKMTAILALALAAAGPLAGTGLAAEPPERPAPVARRADEGLFEKGYLLALTGKFAEARAVFESLREAFPESAHLAEALFWTGYCRVEAGEYKEAAEAYARLAREHPASAFADDALLKLGEVYQVHLKDYRKAIEAYARLGRLEDNPLAPVALNRGGQIYQYRYNDFDRARDNYQRAIDVDAKQRAGRAVEPVPNISAAQAKQEIVQLDNNMADDYQAMRWYVQGRNEQEAGNWGAANTFNGQIITAYPESPLVPEAMLGIAECLTREGELEEAREKYAEILERFPESEAAKRAAPAKEAVERASEIRASRRRSRRGR